MVPVSSHSWQPTPHSLISLSLPTSTTCSSIFARTPWPLCSCTSSMRCWSMGPEYACFTDSAMGWFEYASACAAMDSRRSGSMPACGWMATTLNEPSVSVPVLSNTTVSVPASVSR